MDQSGNIQCKVQYRIPLTREAIILLNTTSVLVFSHFYGNGNVEYNSFFRYSHMFDGITLHEALIEKILYSGNKSYHSVITQ